LKKIVIILMCALASFNLSGQEKARKAAAAGTFYPADKPSAMQMLSDCFGMYPGKTPDQSLVAVIVPHAGWVFSGPVAAAAYSLVPADKKFEHIFLIGPSHYVYLQGASIDTGFGYAETPLGNARIDAELGEKLIKENSCFSYNPDAHKKEHCLEVQLPFLQFHLQSMPPVVPIIIGCEDLEVIKEVAAALKPYLNRKNLFVISSDFSHYPKYEDAVKVDGLTGKAVETGSLDKFIEVLSDNSESGIPNLATSACGQAAIAVLMCMTAGASTFKYEHLKYQNSGDTSFGGKDEVVGYHAFAITCDAPENEGGFSLTEAERSTLLGIARKSIENRLNRDNAPGYEGMELSAALKEKCGAFVTLNEGGELRGCIGHFGSDTPLYKVVDSMAKEAAFGDPRFFPVRKDELERIEIEISVLTPMKRIKSADEFTLGKQGIYMEKNGRGGTFLPQVAEETGWTKEEFLGHCAADKAGIGWDGWKTADLYTYEALVFKEK
jgi:AmmeMemoRadiSam system protein B/AmmeMemoRadiSam system protein A